MSAPAQAIQEAPALDLAGLRQMNFEQLDRLYRSGKRPATISDLNGDAKGAMLAWRVPGRGHPLMRVPPADGRPGLLPDG